MARFIYAFESRIYTIWWVDLCHREDSSVTQTIPKSTLLSWGGWPCEKIFPAPGHAASPVLLHLSGHSDLIVLKPFDLAQVCQGNKICSKLSLTWKLTLELLFPAHCISNWKLNGISRTNIYKVTLNAANELPTLQSGPVVRDRLGGLGGGVKLCSGAWKHGPESPVGVISLCLGMRAGYTHPDG